MGWFIVLLLLQVLVFNHVHIFGYATPLPYVYFLLILPSETPRWLYVVLGFVLGLLVDLFTNTPGMAAGALCFMGLLLPLLLRIFAARDNDDDAFEPSHKTMEWSGFLKYAVTGTVIFCALFFTLEAFSFFDWKSLLINIMGSSVLTSLFIIAIELIRKK